MINLLRDDMPQSTDYVNRGWISNKSLIAFDEQSLLAKVVVKNLCIDQNYLEAVVEGCRISRHGKHYMHMHMLCVCMDVCELFLLDIGEMGKSICLSWY